VKKARGERVGNVPYGKAPGPGPSLTEAAGEIATLKWAQALRAEGLSYHALVARLEAEGYILALARPDVVAIVWHARAAA
jgi:hypothetical protein